MMVMLMFVFIVIIVMMVMLMFVFIVIIVMMVSAHRTDILCRQLFQRLLQRIPALHCRQDSAAIQLRPGGGDDHRIRVMLPQQRHARLPLFLAHTVGAAENDAAGMLHLIVIEFAKILHIHLAFGRIRHCGKGVETHLRALHLTDCPNHIAELSYAGGLNQNPVGVQLLQHLLQRLGEIPHQAAADTTGIHLGDLDACFLKKTAVNADLAEFVFNQHQLFALIGFGNQLFDQRGLAGTQKPGEYIYFGHTHSLFSTISHSPWRAYYIVYHAMQGFSSQPVQPPAQSGYCVRRPWVRIPG